MLITRRCRCRGKRRDNEKASGNKVAAAELLRISRKKLYAKIAKYHLTSVSGN